MELKGKQVLVIGLGESGLAMARWLARQGAAVRVADSRVAPPNEAALHRYVPEAELICGAFVASTFSGIELMAISPGVPVQELLVQEALTRGVPLVSEIELFAWGVRAITPQAKIVAITGSNGKTTTTALTAHLLNASGMRAVACGNISPAVLDALMSALDSGSLPAAWVLELSSFQLETTLTLNADAATVLNVSEDHLDRYADLEAYAAAKQRVFQGAGVMVINRDDARCAAWSLPARTVITFGLEKPAAAPDYGLDYSQAGALIVRGEEVLIRLDALKIVGLHNAANAMAALALCEAIGVPPQSVLPALADFSGLAHRVERVAEVNGVSYYDDSKGTNVGATLAAVTGMGCPLAIILGGEGKGQDFSPLREALAQHARAVALIGRDAPLIATAIEGCGCAVRTCVTMDEAVRWCAAQVQAGEAVLLSPACASFDMFRGYAHRAEVFINSVHALKNEAAG